MVQPSVAEAELEGFPPQGQTKDLMAHADPEQGEIHLSEKGFHELDALHSGCGIPGPVGEEHSLGVMGKNLIEISVRWHHYHFAAMGDQSFEDGSLDAEVNRYHSVGP